MKLDDWFVMIIGVTGLFSAIFLSPYLMPWIEEERQSLSDCTGAQAISIAMFLSMLIAETPMLIIILLQMFNLITMLAAVACAGIVAFCIVCMVAWFAHRNRTIKLGERKTK
jgi:hypothetical protein